LARSKLPACSRNFQPDQIGAHGNEIAHFRGEPDNLAFGGRRNFDGGLIGHHGGKRRIFLYEIANLDMPFHEFRFGNALADIGQFEHKLAHCYASTASRKARPARAGLGK
jgi:hypothetical protein